MCKTVMGKPDRAEFGNPPVVEVVFSVVLDNPIPFFGFGFVMKLGEMFGDKYPFVQDHPILQKKIESFGRPGDIMAQVEFRQRPPFPRIWFVSEDDTQVVQVQDDRFSFNWRKVTADTEYPRFDAVFSDFKETLNLFLKAARELGFKQVNPVQFEITYVSRIKQGAGFVTFRDLGKIFPFLNLTDLLRNSLPDPPTGVNCTVSYDLHAGRLHCTVKTAKVQNTRWVDLNLSVRGIGDVKSFGEGMDRWYINAHDKLVDVFLEITDTDVQDKQWLRKEQ